MIDVSLYIAKWIFWLSRLAFKLVLITFSLPLFVFQRIKHFQESFLNFTVSLSTIFFCISQTPNTLYSLLYFLPPVHHPSSPRVKVTTTTLLPCARLPMLRLPPVMGNSCPLTGRWATSKIPCQHLFPQTPGSKRSGSLGRESRLCNVDLSTGGLSESARGMNIWRRRESSRGGERGWAVIQAQSQQWSQATHRELWSWDDPAELTKLR